MKILLDANFLLYCAKQKIDYISEINSGEVVVLSPVVREIEKLKEGAEKAGDRQDAELALQILEKNIREGRVRVLKTGEKNGDNAIMAEARQGDIVATMDKELKKKLKRKTRILIIKGKKKIEML